MKDKRKNEWEIIFSETKTERQSPPAIKINKMLDKKSIWIKFSQNKDIILLATTEVLIIIYIILALLGVLPFF